MRDEYRVDYDEGRGGYGNIVKAQLTQRQRDMVTQMKEYEAGQEENYDERPSKRAKRKGESDDSDSSADSDSD